MGGSPEIHREFRRIFLAAPGAEVASAITPVAPVPTAGAFAVDSADHGAEAAEKVMQSRADDRPYAVAFIEVGMASGSDALSTVEMLWRADPALQIVVCTGCAEDSWEKMPNWLEARDNLVILKRPFGNIEVLQFARVLTGKWHLARQANLPVDVSERLHPEVPLHQAQKMEAVGQLAAGVAHDFNNLLTIIQGHASLQLSVPGHNESATDSLHQIAFAAARAGDLTRQLLAFSRRQIMRPRVIHLNALIRELTGMLRRLVGERIELVCDLAEDVPPVWADHTGLEQVLTNLALNARDAMPRGGRISIATAAERITLEDRKSNPEAVPGDYAVLSVTDTGTGIDPETRARIFEPFFSTKETNQGTGMGLATVYGIIKQHDGWIDVSTEIGQGSQFRVLLPATDRPAEPVENVATSFTLTAASHTILIVEDDEAVRGLVREVLVHSGYRVLEAETGEAALEVWEQHADEIDLLLTDMVMPGSVNGLDLARQLLARRPGLKVIYTSGYSAELFGSDVKLQDGHNYLPKPYLSAKLIGILNRALQCAEEPAPGR